MNSNPGQSSALNGSTDIISADICIVGGGPGGIALAIGAAAFGQRVVLIERHKLGGDSLNYGCAPSKSLIAAARYAGSVRAAGKFGVITSSVSIDHKAVRQAIRSNISGLALNASPERLSGFGVRVIPATGSFTDRETITTAGYKVKARRFVIATGSSPVIPDIPGLSSVPYFTNETIFDVDIPIPHLVIIGAGRTGLELAQAYRTLGSDVTVVDNAKPLAQADPELSGPLLAKLNAEGIAIHARTALTRISSANNLIRIEASKDGQPLGIDGTHLLIAAGRKPNIANLGLDAAGIKHNRSAIKVNGGLRTSNRKVYAIGDVNGVSTTTAEATDDAAIVLKRILFRLPASRKTRTVPSAIFTAPELASAGLSEDAARAKYRRIRVLRWAYSETDRSHIDRETGGHVKVVLTNDGKILGAHILGTGAAEMIALWSLAISQGLNIKAVAATIIPYPTLAEVSKKAASASFSTLSGNPIVRKAVALLAKLG